MNDNSIMTLVTSVKPLAKCGGGDRVTSNNTLSANSIDDSGIVISDNDNDNDDKGNHNDNHNHNDDDNHMCKPRSNTAMSTTLNTTSTTTVNANSSNFIADDSSSLAQYDCTIMPEDFSRKLVVQVKRRLDNFLVASPYVRKNCRLKDLPRFTDSQLDLGKVLAKGGFSNIIELNSFYREETKEGVLSPQDEHDNNGRQCQDHHHHQQQQTSVGSGELVVKCLSTQLPLKKLPGATKDIVFEAYTLASLQHKNIVEIRGWSQDGIEGFQNSRRADGFFIILDRLGDTLFQKVFQWQAQLHKSRAGGTKLGDMLKTKASYQKLLQNQFHEKIQICIDVASALAYCHERRICHRDIKSANVAVDRHGNAKLIDFGLAVELPALQPGESPHRVYEMTGNIGTARYMSPEIIVPVPGLDVHRYNEKSDVHSFAILCWEACAAKKPYGKLDAKQVKEHVSLWNERPNPYWSWPRKLRNVLKKGWARDPKQRPTMADFHATLLKVQASLPRATVSPPLTATKG